MITYIVCVYRPELYHRVCYPQLERQQREYGAQVIQVSSEDSIREAYEAGRQQAEHPIACYLHEDVELLDNNATEIVLGAMHATGAGVSGVVGSAYNHKRCPWWKAKQYVGGWATEGTQGLVWNDGPSGNTQSRYDSQAPVRARAHLLDGIVLADRMGDTPWERGKGWHGYDIDRCMQAHRAGLEVWTMPLRVVHHNQPHDEAWTKACKPTWLGMKVKWGLD